MAFKKEIKNNVIITFPENTFSKIPLVIFVSGVTSVANADKVGMEKFTPASLKQKVIIIYKNHGMTPSIKECISIGQNTAKQYNIEISDIKVLGFSGGGQDIRDEISDEYSYIGLIDPSVHPNLERFESVASRIRMTYNPSQWGGKNKKLGENQPVFGKQVIEKGGKAELTDWIHIEAPAKFLQLFEAEIAKPVDDPKKNTIQATSVISPGVQPQFGNPPISSVPIIPPKPIPIGDFERRQNYSSIDKLGPTLDRKTTTINGVIAYAAQNILYKNNTLEGIDNFKGQVLRVQKITADKESTDSVSFLGRLLGNDVIKCKVRIPEVHLTLPIPSSFDTNENDVKIIDIYPDFVYDPLFPAFQDIQVGAIVEVTFENLSNFTGGRILNVVGQQANPMSQTLSGVVGAVNTARAFLGAGIDAIFKSASANNNKLITEKQFKKMFPELSSQTISFYTESLNAILPLYGINTPFRVAAFIGQAGAESRFKYLTELPSKYNKKNINDPSEPVGTLYEGREKGLGNTEPGDGPKYKGRGLLQITGRDNYTKVNNLLQKIDKNIDIVTNPDLVASDLRVSILASCEVWGLNGRSQKMLTYADNWDIVSISIAINGGERALKERIELSNLAKSILTGATGV